MAIRSGAEFVETVRVKDEASGPLKKAEQSASSFSVAMIAANQSLELAQKAFSIVSGSLSAVVNPFLEAEDGIKRLRNTLAIVGEQNIPKAIEGFKAWSTELQESAGVGDDLAIKLVTLAKATGLTDERSKQLVETAADLSAVTGKDLDTSFQKLMGSFKGSAGSLVDLHGDLQNLTKEQLQNGMAVDILAAKYRGFAKAELSTFAGQSKVIANLLDEIAENIGKAVFDLLPIKSTKNVVIELLKALQDMSEGLSSIAKNISATFQGIAAAIGSVNWQGFLVGAQVVILTLTVMFPAAAVAFGASMASMIPQIWAFVAASAAAARNAAFFAAQIAVVGVQAGLVVAGVSTLVFYVELLARNFKNLGDVWTVTWTALYGGILEISKAISESGLLGNLSRPVEEINKDLEELATRSAKASENLDFGVTGEAFENLQNTIGEFAETYKNARKEVDKPLDIKLPRQPKIPALGGGNADDAMKVIDEIEAARRQAGVDLAMLTKNETDRAKIGLAQEQQALQVLRQRITLSKDLTGTQKEQLQAIVNQSAALKQQAFDIKTAEAATQKYLDIETGLEAVKRELARLDMDAVELAEDELNHQLALIEAERIKLSVDREANAAALEALYLQQQFTKELGERKKLEAGGGANILAGFSASISKTFDDVKSDFLKPLGEFWDKIYYENADQNIIQNLGDAAENFGRGLQSHIKAGFKPENLKELGKDIGLKVFQAFDSALTFLADNFVTIFEGLGDILGGAMVSAFAGVLDSLANIGDVWNEAFEKIDKALVKLLNTVPKAIQQIIVKLPEIAKRIADALPMIAQALADAAPSLTAAIVKAMPQVIIAIGQGLSILAEALPAVVEQIAKGLPDIILALAKAVPQVIQAFVEAMPAIAEALADNAGPIAEALVIALVGGSGKIAAGLINEMLVNGGLERIGGAILRGFRDALLGAISGLAKVFKGAMPTIDGDSLKPLKDAAKNLKDALTTDRSALFNVTDLLDEAAGGASQEAAKIFGAITHGMSKATSLLQQALDAMLGLWRQFWDGLVNTWRQLWDTLTNLWRQLWDGLVNIWRGLWDGLTTAWRAVWDGISLLWNGMISLLSEAWNVIFGVLKTVWTELLNLISPIFKPLQDFATSLTDLVASAFAPVIAIFGGKTPSLVGVVGTAFMPVTDIFGGKTPSLFATVLNSFKPVTDIFGGKAPSLIGTVSLAFAPITEIFGGKTPTLISTVSKAFEPIVDIFAGKSPKIVANADKAFDPIIGIFGGKAPDVVDNVKKAFEGVMSLFGGKKPTVVDTLKLAFNPITSFKWSWPELSTPGFVSTFSNAVNSLGNTPGWLSTLTDAVNRLGSIGGGSGGGGGMLGKVFGSTGGLVTPSGIQYFADGGMARGSDTVPAMLTPGEFIVNRSAAGENMSALRNLNNGGSFGSSVTIQKIEINGANMTADQIASQVIPKIDQHLKRKSQDGGFVIAKSGIRG